MIQFCSVSVFFFSVLSSVFLPVYAFSVPFSYPSFFFVLSQLCLLLVSSPILSSLVLFCSPSFLLFPPVLFFLPLLFSFSFILSSLFYTPYCFYSSPPPFILTPFSIILSFLLFHPHTLFFSSPFHSFLLLYLLYYLLPLYFTVSSFHFFTSHRVLSLLVVNVSEILEGIEKQIPSFRGVKFSSVDLGDLGQCVSYCRLRGWSVLYGVDEVYLFFLMRTHFTNASILFCVFFFFNIVLCSSFDSLATAGSPAAGSQRCRGKV